MNERIRQLAEQAGLRFTQLMTNPMVPVVDGKETDLAKFAELIVLECLNQCYNRGMNDGLYAGQLQAASYIEEHFGVDKK
tara:strand:+ start:66 stop:305 length:240 start_codon:yes stop_codon:yes gene_type:complete